MESASPATKLDMDLRGASRLGGHMEELDDRVAALCTRIGMLMEDASVEALTIASLEFPARIAAINRLGTAISEMTNLLRQVRELSA